VTDVAARREARDRLVTAIEALHEAAQAADASVRGDTTPEREFARRWSSREVVLHLVAVEREVWQARLATLVAAEPARWSYREPGLWSGPGDETLDSALAAFDAARRTTLSTIDSLDEETWRRHGIHERYGQLDTVGLLGIAADHDEEHLEQIRALRRGSTIGA
jgi:hypothetical protein